MGNHASVDMNNPDQFLVQHDTLGAVLTKLQRDYHLKDTWWHPLVNDITESRTALWASLEKNENGSLDDSVPTIVRRVMNPEHKLSEDDEDKLAEELFKLLDWGTNREVNQLEFEIVSLCLLKHGVHTGARLNPFAHERIREWEASLTRQDLITAINLRVITLDGDETEEPQQQGGSPSSPLQDRNRR